MVMIRIPFLPRFRDAMLNGTKGMTSRTKRMAKIGDVFEASGQHFKLLPYLKQAYVTVQITGKKRVAVIWRISCKFGGKFIQRGNLNLKIGFGFMFSAKSRSQKSSFNHSKWGSEV